MLSATTLRHSATYSLVGDVVQPILLRGHSAAYPLYYIPWDGLRGCPFCVVAWRFSPFLSRDVVQPILLRGHSAAYPLYYILSDPRPPPLVTSS